MQKFEGLILVAALCGIYSCNHPAVVVQVELAGVDSFEISNPQFQATLYGYNPYLQDVPAMVVAQSQLEARKLPTVFQLEVLNTEAKMPSGVLINHYYLVVQWDANGDGVKSDGDLVVDYDKGFPSIVLDPNVLQTIYLKPFSAVMP